MPFNIQDLVAKPKQRRMSDRTDLNDMLGQTPETGFLQNKPPPSPTPTPQPKKKPK